MKASISASKTTFNILTKYTFEQIARSFSGLFFYLTASNILVIPRYNSFAVFSTNMEKTLF